MVTPQVSGSPGFCCPTILFDILRPDSGMMVLWGQGAYFSIKLLHLNITSEASTLLVQHTLVLQTRVGDQLDAVRQGWIFPHPCNGSPNYSKCKGFSCDTRRALEVQETVDRL